MFHITHWGQNAIEIANDKARVFFSYDTPVAAYIYGRGFVRTATYYSRTTSEHINAWLGGAAADSVSQSEIESLIN